MPSVVLSIPHAATALPDEVRRDYLPHVDPQFLRSQSDIDTDLVYAIHGVRAVRFGWSRFLADPNRGEQQDSDGGVVPLRDFDGEPIYRPGGEPDGEERWRRVLRYHRPFHERVAAEVADPRTRFFIDGHSMAGTAPRRSLDHGKPRPDAVLCNRGDALGYRLDDNVAGMDPAHGGGPLTCPAPLLQDLTERLSHWLTALPVPSSRVARAPVGSVWINDPFPGGHVVRTHARPAQGVPGVMLELNQALWCDERSGERVPGRVEWMRRVLERWIEDVVRLRDAWEGMGPETLDG